MKAGDVARIALRGEPPAPNGDGQARRPLPDGLAWRHLLLAHDIHTMDQLNALRDLTSDGGVGATRAREIQAAVARIGR